MCSSIPNAAISSLCSSHEFNSRAAKSCRRLHSKGEKKKSKIIKWENPLLQEKTFYVYVRVYNLKGKKKEKKETLLDGEVIDRSMSFHRFYKKDFHLMRSHKWFQLDSSAPPTPAKCILQVDAVSVDVKESLEYKESKERKKKGGQQKMYIRSRWFYAESSWM